MGITTPVTDTGVKTRIGNYAQFETEDGGDTEETIWKQTIDFSNLDYLKYHLYITGNLIGDGYVKIMIAAATVLNYSAATPKTVYGTYDCTGVSGEQVISVLGKAHTGNTNLDIKGDMWFTES